MAPLPKERVQVMRPFAVTGVDFAGPIIVKSGVRRVIGVKAWIAVFVLPQEQFTWRQWKICQLKFSIFFKLHER